MACIGTPDTKKNTGSHSSGHLMFFIIQKAPAVPPLGGYPGYFAPFILNGIIGAKSLLASGRRFGKQDGRGLGRHVTCRFDASDLRSEDTQGTSAKEHTQAKEHT